MENGLKNARELLSDIALEHRTGRDDEEIENAPSEILRKYPELALFIDPKTAGQGTRHEPLVNIWAPNILRALEDGDENKIQAIVELIQITAQNLVEAINNLLDQAEHFISAIENEVKESDKGIKIGSINVHLRREAIASAQSFLESQKNKLLIIKAALEYSRNGNHQEVAEKLGKFLDQIKSAYQEALRKLNELKQLSGST